MCPGSCHFAPSVNSSGFLQDLVTTLRKKNISSFPPLFLTWSHREVTPDCPDPRWDDLKLAAPCPDFDTEDCAIIKDIQTANRWSATAGFTSSAKMLQANIWKAQWAALWTQKPGFVGSNHYLCFSSVSTEIPSFKWWWVTAPSEYHISAGGPMVTSEQSAQQTQTVQKKD